MDAVDWSEDEPGGPDPGSPTRLLTRRQVASLFGVSASTVTRWAHQGLLRSVRTPGGHYRFPEAEVKRLARHSELPRLTRLD